MKILVAILWVTACIVDVAEAAKPSDMDGLHTANGRVVADFVDTLFNQHHGELAYDRYVDRLHYVSHGNLGVDTGQPPPQLAGDAARSQFDRTRRLESLGVTQNPNIHMDIKKILVQGDLVFLQLHAVNGLSSNGDLMWMLYRVNNGKITEDWNTHNTIPDDQVNKQW